MRRFDDLDEYWSPGLVLTVRGREYTIPLPSAELGLWCQRIAAAAGQISQASTDEEIQAALARAQAVPELDGQDLTLAQRLLGSAYDEMISAGVPWPYIEFCSGVAFVWIVAGEQAAERWWTSGGRPEALRPGNRAQRRAEAKESRATGRTGGAVASGMKQRASSSGTRSRQKRRRGGPVEDTTGRPSSPTGRP